MTEPEPNEDAFLAELADRMAPDFEVYEVMPADEVFAAVKAGAGGRSQ